MPSRSLVDDTAAGVDGSTERERPLRGYAVLTMTFLGLSSAFAAWLGRSGRPIPDNIGVSDLALVAIATHKASRLVSKDRVTSVLRAPFTRHQDDATAGEVEEAARGHGLRLAIGELLVCPYCIGMWVAGGLTAGVLVAPRFTRWVAFALTALTASDFLQIAYKKAVVPSGQPARNASDRRAKLGRPRADVRGGRGYGCRVPTLRRALSRMRVSLDVNRGTFAVVAAIAGGAAVVGVGVGVLLVGIVNLRSDTDTALRSSALLERVIAVEDSVVDAETGLRGYVITDATIFLAPLRTAERNLPREVRALGLSAERQHDHVTAAHRLGAAGQDYMDTYVPNVLALMRTNPARARGYAVTLGGKQRVDSIRGQAASLEHALGAQETSRQRAASATAGDDISYGIIILVVLVVLTLVSQGVFGRLFLSRQRALRRSRETARDLQTALLPLAIPDLPGCDLAIRFTPAGAGDVVGGDFYDVFELDAPNRFAVIIGDVCGKGAVAAATTAVARWTLRSGSLLTATPIDALRHLNEVMLRRRQRFLFATITYLLLEIGAEDVHVTVACAGHPPPIVLASAQAPAPVAARGDLVGIWPQLRLQTSEIRLAPGDLIVAYSDGATDFSPEPIQPLERFLLDADTGSADSVAAAIEARALAGRPTPRDDIAIVAIQFHGTVPTDPDIPGAVSTPHSSKRAEPEAAVARSADAE
jgi:CHASE3 domain sensor protein